MNPHIVTIQLMHVARAADIVSQDPDGSIVTADGGPIEGDAAVVIRDMLREAAIHAPYDPRQTLTLTVYGTVGTARIEAPGREDMTATVRSGADIRALATAFNADERLAA